MLATQDIERARQVPEVDATQRAQGSARDLAVAGPGSVLVAVKDNGTGPDPAVEERMFQPFFTTKPDGLGMGLAICRSIVEAHGGGLWAAPRAPHGADVRFTERRQCADIVGNLEFPPRSQFRRLLAVSMEISLGARRSDRSFCVRPSLGPCCGNYPCRQHNARGSGILLTPQFRLFQQYRREADIADRGRTRRSWADSCRSLFASRRAGWGPEADISSGSARSKRRASADRRRLV
jgi:hypothetical protein